MALDPRKLVEWMLADGLDCAALAADSQVHLGAYEEGRLARICDASGSPRGNLCKWVTAKFFYLNGLLCRQR